MNDYKNKTAVITGAASGIGRGLAKKCAALGMNTWVADIDEAAVDKLARDLGENVFPVRIDVTRLEDVNTLAEKVFNRFGCVNLLFNNAGIFAAGKVWGHSLSDWKRVIDVNLWGVVHGMQAFTQRMIDSGEPGRILNTASAVGIGNAPGIGVYAASKHAVVALTESLYLDLEASGSAVTASVICPGPIKTAIAQTTGEEKEDQLVGVQALKIYLAEQGMDPDEHAEIVFRAIDADKFWILSHKQIKEYVQSRFRSILEDTNPTYKAMNRE